MILAAVASLLLVAGQTLPPDPAPPQNYEQPAGEASEDALEAADEDAAEAVEGARSGGADIDEEEEARICRRHSYYDDFGRQRSRKSCRPRD